MSVTTPNTQKLEELLRPHREAVDVLKEALKEVNKEEAEKKKDAAKDLIRKAMELQGRMDAAERTFNSEKKKFDKELGKIMNRLRNMASGRPIDEGEHEDEGKEQPGDSAQQ